MRSLLALINAEPVRVAALLAIVVNLAVSFGLRLTVEQIALINAAAAAILAIIVRSKVSPV